jgi:hypothetical protein
MDYTLEDFSQSAINNGQRKINYALTVVDKKLAVAIEALRDVIEALPPSHNMNLDAVNKAIMDVYKTSERVASIKPPGCDTSWE